MSKNDKYFQFPIAALRTIGTRKKKSCLLNVDRDEANKNLDSIIEFCVVDAGRKFVARHNSDAVENMIRRQVESCGYKLDGSEHAMHVVVGLDVCGVQHGSASITRTTYFDRCHWIQGLSSSKQVRLRADLLWDYRASKNDWTWREFAILCGVYAGIGRHSSQRLSFEYIGALASGYSRLQDAKQNVELPARHLIRYTVQALERRGLFTSLSPNRRHVYYSNNLDVSGLSKVLVDRKLASAKTQRQAAQQELENRIKEIDEHNRRETETQRQAVLHKLKVMNPEAI